MLKIGMDEAADAVYIKFSSDPVGYGKELDDLRIVDYSLNPGEPVGVSLHAVSEGVKLEGLPQPDKVRSILGGLGVEVV